MIPETHPDDHALARHLMEELVGDQAAAIESHVGDCEACQRRIESMAALEQWWQVLPSCLSGLRVDGGSIFDSDFTSASPDELWHVENQQIQSILSPTDDPSKLGRLGAYEIVGIVGAGATAVVLKALDVALNRYVAIKLLRPTLAASPIARKRFAREARAAASIVHENVIEIHGVCEVDGLPYLVMPYVRGESLAKRIERSWPLSTDAMLHIACQVADGLSAAHDKGLIHRDVKPSNILLGDGVERLKLTDFGLARAIDDVGLTRSGTLAGTPEYMSPEQARGNAIDHRSDLFSLGSVMYAMCTGQPPFTSDSCYGVLRRIIEEQPRPIHQLNRDVPDWMCRLVERLMEKHCDKRFQSASTVATTLRQCLNYLRDPNLRLPEEIQAVRPRHATRTVMGLLVGFIALAVLITAVKLVPPKPVESPQANVGVVADRERSTEPSDAWDDGVGELLDEVSGNLKELEMSLKAAD